MDSKAWIINADASILQWNFQNHCNLFEWGFQNNRPVRFRGIAHPGNYPKWLKVHPNQNSQYLLTWWRLSNRLAPGNPENAVTRNMSINEKLIIVNFNMLQCLRFAFPKFKWADVLKRVH